MNDAAAQAREQYLSSQVMTAPPHKLHLMMIESAIRNGRLAIKLLEENDGDWLDAIFKCRELVHEIMLSFESSDEELDKKVKGVYVFLANRLLDARRDSSVAPLQEVIKVLEVEAETWREVCAAAESPGMQQDSRNTDLPAPHNTVSTVPAGMNADSVAASTADDDNDIGLSIEC